MAVLPSNPRKVLVVHGVQSGDNSKINRHLDISNLIHQRMQSHFDFDVEMFRYEDINDKSQLSLRNALKLLDFGLISGKIVDTVGDVLSVINDDQAAQDVRNSLRDRILEVYHNDESPLYLVAHSLGTVYALDVINELMTQSDMFDSNDRTTWPVQGFVTIGSPLALNVFGRDSVQSIGNGEHKFRWYNYVNPTDPVTTGDIFGIATDRLSFVERFGANPDCGWTIRDRIIDASTTWFAGHSSYWNNAQVGDDLIELVTS